jgi:hypothetical protein
MFGHWFVVGSQVDTKIFIQGEEKLNLKVAEPHFLGKIKAAMSPKVMESVFTWVEKDLGTSKELSSAREIAKTSGSKNVDDFNPKDAPKTIEPTAH